MKILITNHHLNFFTGSENFTATLAEALKKRGHEVFIFSPCLGSAFDDRLKVGGITASNNLKDYESLHFDIIHAQHNTTAILARSIFPETPMVFMTHGKLPGLEEPPSINLGISAYIAVAEGGMERLEKEYSIDPQKIFLVRNIIDTEKFQSEKSVSQKPKKLLVISHHYADEVRNVIESACRETEIEARHIGLPENPVKNVESHINAADIVVSLGRGALEAMACERNVIIFDMHGADGFIDERNFGESKKNNFSGFRFGKKYGKDDFKKEIAKYDPQIGKKLRALVLKEYSIESEIPKLEKIYQAAAREKVAGCQITKGQLYNELNFLENEARKNFEIRKHVGDLQKEIAEKNSEIKKMRRETEESRRETRQNRQELEKCREEIKRKQDKIKLMKSSKFWKLRKRYMKMRGQSVE